MLILTLSLSRSYKIFIILIKLKSSIARYFYNEKSERYYFNLINQIYYYYDITFFKDETFE